MYYFRKIINTELIQLIFNTTLILTVTQLLSSLIKGMIYIYFYTQVLFIFLYFQIEKI